ncbi:MAG: hypothetical protein WBA62_19120 [Xanthobacteraceae bacterium]
MRAYHYSNRKHKPGDTITAGRDSIVMLTPSQRAFEDALRAVSIEKTRIRAESLYLWEAADVIKRTWTTIVHAYRFVYEVEVIESEIQHRGDLNVYTHGCSASNSSDIKKSVDDYWASRLQADQSPRIELLATKAIVIREISDPSEF